MKPEVSVSETAPGEVRPRLGVSSCLLGQPVRFNGGRSRNRFVRHHADGCSAVYLAAQTYLDPFPAGLGLRNHAPGPSAPSGKSGQSRQSDRAPAPKTAADATKGARG